MNSSPNRENWSRCGPVTANISSEVAEQSAAILLGSQQARWARRLDQESENLRAVSQWCSEDESRSGHRLRLVSGLWEYWHITRPAGGGRPALDGALAVAEGPPRARADALNGLGVIVSLRGELERSAVVGEAIEFYQRAGDLRGESRAWTHLGNALNDPGAIWGCRHAFDRGLALSRQSGEGLVRGVRLYLSGWAATVGNDLAAVDDRVSRSAKPFSGRPVTLGSGYAVAVLAHCAVRDGRAGEALRMLRSALSVFEHLPERWGLLYDEHHGGSVCCSRDWPQVATLLGIMDSLGERTGGQLFPHQLAEIDTIATVAKVHSARRWRRGHGRQRHRPGRRDTAPCGHRLIGRATGRRWQPWHVAGPSLTRREQEVRN